MDDHRTPDGRRDLQLGAEDLALHISGREVVVIVEADFADGPRSGHRHELVARQATSPSRLIRKLMRLVRVNADGEAHFGPDRLDSRRLCRLRTIAGFEDDNDAFHAGGLCTLDDLLEIARERFVSKMAMCVDHLLSSQLSALSCQLPAFSCQHQTQALNALTAGS